MGFESVGHLHANKHEDSTVTEHQDAKSWVGVCVFSLTEFYESLVNVPDNDSYGFKNDKAFESVLVRELLGLLLELSNPLILLAEFGCEFLEKFLW